MLHPRARTMLLLSLPAVAIGIASSLILIVVMKIASVLQNLLWQRLPGTLGIAQDSPLWIIGVLTLTGIAVGLVIRFSQGHAGPDPACEPLIGAPVPPSALPGLIVALILGLAGGVSLGPEHPIMTVNIALAVAIGARLLPRVNRMEWTILASAGTVSYTHLRAHETRHDLVCRLLLEKKNPQDRQKSRMPSFACKKKKKRKKNTKP